MITVTISNTGVARRGKPHKKNGKPATLLERLREAVLASSQQIQKLEHKCQAFGPLLARTDVLGF